MAAGFGWRTLQKALLGRPVWDLHYSYIAQWIDRFLPAPPVRDGKAAAAGEREGNEEPAEIIADAEESEGATRTVRGSR